MSNVYYRVQVADDGVHVCHLQWFDEHDYDAAKWDADEHGAPLRFDTEAGAEAHARLLRGVS